MRLRAKLFASIVRWPMITTWLPLRGAWARHAPPRAPDERRANHTPQRKHAHARASARQERIVTRARVHAAAPAGEGPAGGDGPAGGRT